MVHNGQRHQPPPLFITSFTPMSNLRTLTVKVVEAKDVIACDKGKSSDPYCKIELLDAKTEKVRGL